MSEQHEGPGHWVRNTLNKVGRFIGSLSPQDEDDRPGDEYADHPDFSHQAQERKEIEIPKREKVGKG